MTMPNFELEDFEIALDWLEENIDKYQNFINWIDQKINVVLNSEAFNKNEYDFLFDIDKNGNIYFKNMCYSQYDYHNYRFNYDIHGYERNLRSYFDTGYFYTPYIPSFQPLNKDIVLNFDNNQNDHRHLIIIKSLLLSWRNFCKINLQQ
jgi:hypothetical protein